MCETAMRTLPSCRGLRQRDCGGAAHPLLQQHEALACGNRRAANPGRATETNHGKRHPSLPESIPFRQAFLAVLLKVTESGYSRLIQLGSYDDHDEFKADMANAVQEACDALGTPELADDPECMGEMLAWAEEAGWVYVEDRDED